MEQTRMQRACLWICILVTIVLGQQDQYYIDLTTSLPTIMNDAKLAANTRFDREIYMANQMKDIVDSGPFRFVYNFFKSQPYAKVLSRSAVTSMTALRLIRQKYHMSGAAAVQTLREAHVTSMLRPLPGIYHPDTPMPVAPDIDYCPYPKELKCNVNQQERWIRTIDGSCNNVHHNILGRSMTPFRRLLPAKYSDGIEEFRRSVTDEPLPGARFLSFHLFQDVNKPSVDITMLFVFFGQFTDHDLTRTAATLVPSPHRGEPMMEIKCGIDGCLQNVEGLEACAPIPVSIDDVDFAAFNRCLKFVRNLEVPSITCEPGPREQLNQVTHWLDGSEIYGSTKEELDLLRDYSDIHGGKMAVITHPERLKPLLPREVVVSEPSMCSDFNQTVHCFQAGDPRVNENAGLGTLHILMVRYHNVIETQLHSLNPNWSGERLFQETRRIIAAVLQHITYNEWLPLLLGPQVIIKNNLDLLARGYFQEYDSELDGRIPNEFATAAFRLGHTLLQEKLRRISSTYQTDDSLFLSQTFNHPEHLYNTKMGGIDAFIRGLSHKPSQSYDHFFTKQITRSLFADKPPHGPGHDLLSLNIQRGRDHGLGTYNDYREFCGLARARSFQDLSSEIKDASHIRTLAILYRDVNDIDLFVGGISEQPVRDGIAGPTFACIIADTFRNLRRADRLWYEGEQAGFTPEQLQEIRKITLARILCINGDEIHRIQPYAFLQPGRKPAFYKHTPDDSFNRPVSCESLPDIDLRPWTAYPNTPL